MESSRLFFDPSTCQGNMLFLGSGDSFYRGQRMMLSMEDTSKRRPFFCSQDDLFDEEYYDEQLPEKKRRLSPEQVHLLEKSFEAENKLEPERKTQLAKKLGLQPRQVAVWFQNRRARWKTKQLERDYDHLKASYDSLLSSYDNVVKENEKLKSEVVSLTEKLQAKETQTSGQLCNLDMEDTPDVIAPAPNLKAEDHLSSGSLGSAVVDEDSPQLVDSGDSYFPDNYIRCVVLGGGIQLSEEDGSDNGQSYFSNMFAAAGPQQHDEEPLGWWDWP